MRFFQKITKRKFSIDFLTILQKIRQMHFARVKAERVLFLGSSLSLGCKAYYMDAPLFSKRLKKIFIQPVFLKTAPHDTST